MSKAAKGDGGSPDVYINDQPALREGDVDDGGFFSDLFGGGDDLSICSTIFINDKLALKGGDSPDVDNES